jgi:predicted transcriptional regulator
MNHKTRTWVRLDPETVGRLRAIANRRGSTVSAVIREAVLAYLRRQRRKEEAS